MAKKEAIKNKRNGSKSDKADIADKAVKSVMLAKTDIVSDTDSDIDSESE